MTMHVQCFVCGGADLAPLVEMTDVPVHCNVVCKTREEALAMPRADLDLAVCRDCGHIFNRAFDPERMRYDGAYENSLHGSGLFQAYADALADRLIADHDLRGKDVVEIGCGNGAFLDLICAKGGNRGFGFDPSGRPRDEGANGEDVRIFADYYGEAYGRYKGDLVICRHVLEHIEEPGAFVDLLRSAMKDESSRLFVEVPNGMYTLITGHIWDLIYEHCSYFCESSLARLLSDSGLPAIRLAPAYGDQFLCADAAPGSGSGSQGEMPESLRHVEAFSERFHRMVGHWRGELTRAVRDGRTVVAWGAGSKGVTFLNLVDRGIDAVQCIVDVNPKKDGKFVAGAGKRIVAPDALKAVSPDIVLLMNPLYLEEVRRQLSDLGLAPAVKVVEEMDAAPAASMEAS
ncbi:class I SAM-dependent methyltransferase [Ferruginivarius sediminum]|uniref:Methyltransferase domain-containing protein n=1 Tax=Ferruginivarius sediminum TaxID=2661937 RepID=A0A369TAG4_9PROT|nr:class I SAM-dependent methyltransferase [Ferruginivarius sediminum]RDD62268.1 methyltransferase domain-containing protein [Ferruginivarius sediminum]